MFLILGHMSLNDTMTVNNEFVRILKEVIVAYFRAVSQHFLDLGVLRETQNGPVGITGF